MNKVHNMDFYGFVYVGIGATIGAWLRWWLAIMLNPVFPSLPLGTLVANLLGGYLVGIVLAVAMLWNLPSEARLFIITGLLGGLTTFSTFSAEVVTLFMRAEYVYAAVTAGAHMFGSFLMTGLGFLSVQLFKSALK